MVAVAHGARADAGEVRAGLGLGVELAPDLLARQDLSGCAAARNAGEAWASSERAIGPNVTPPATPRSGVT